MLRFTAGMGRSCLRAGEECKALQDRVQSEDRPGPAPAHLPLRSRDQLRPRPQFTLLWAPSWAQSAAPAAPAPSWVQPTQPEGAQQHPRVTWAEHQDTRVPLQQQCNQPLACLSFPSPQKDSYPQPHSSKVTLPLLRRIRPAAGRMQPSGDLHPTAALSPPYGEGGSRGGGCHVCVPSPPRCREASPH